MAHMVTVTDLLDRTDLELEPVVVHQADAPVRWVATSELEDPTPYLEGGEVVLTTGLAMTGRRPDWAAYVSRLVAADVVALGFAAGLTHRRTPVALVRACDAAGLTLFEVPERTAFVTVSRTVGAMLEKAEQAAAREAVQTQRALTQAALRRDDPAALVRALAAALGGAACVLGADGGLEVELLGPAPGSIDLDAARTEVARLRPQGLRAAASLTTGGATTVVQPLGLRGRPASYLVAAAPGRLQEGQRSAITTTVALLGLAAESRHDRRETTRQLRARALELVVTGEPRTAVVVLAAATGTTPAEVRLPARVQALHASGDPERLDDALARIEEDGGGPGVLAGRAGGLLRAVAAPGRTAALAEELATAGLLVGVGSRARVQEAGRSDATAAHALGQATAASPVVWWDRVVGEGALALIEPARAAAYAESFLAPLGAAGPQVEELVATLRSFLRHHGSRGEVAAELGVHRNTVRNRIGQIEAALGRSLNDPQTRVDAWIALQAGAEE